MIVFRALQGFSGGALIPISFRLIIEILPLKNGRWACRCLAL